MELPKMTKTQDEENRMRIEAEVRSALGSELRLASSLQLKEITLENGGSLVLEGDAVSVAAKKLALERAAAVSGITGIVDRLHVVPATPMADGEIRVHLRDALIGDLALEGFEIRELDAGGYQLVRGVPQGAKGAIDVEVQNGIVTLNGRLPGLTSKRLAGVLAWWVPGVRDVINGIEIEPPEADNPDLIEEAVRAAFEKDPLVNAGQIRVGARKTTVRLTGAVPTEAERDAAETDAWCIFGVDNVLNEIEVKP
jgi:osmotically-inducible protein OsmY